MRKLLYLIFISLILAIQCEKDCSQKQQRSSIYDQDFGTMFTNDDVITTMMTPWITTNYYRSWTYMDLTTRDMGSTIKSEKDRFTINLDVQHFASNEIIVKTVRRYVVIEAQHKEKQDEHGLISRKFVRKYILPEDVEYEDIVSQISSDGILTISAPRKVKDSHSEREIPITQTGPMRKEMLEDNEKHQNNFQEKCDH